jgi:hypothetical protein
LKNDVGEEHDLASRQPAKTGELSRLLGTWLTDVKGRFPEPNPNYDAVREAEGYWWKEPGAYERFGR